MKADSYFEAKAYSHYSFLEGVSHPGDLIDAALESGLSGITLSDIGGVYGLPKAYHRLKTIREDENDPRSKAAKSFYLGVGAEIPLQIDDRLNFGSIDFYSVSFLVKSLKGYQLLGRMITESHQGKPKGKGDLSLDRLFQFLNQDHEGASGLYFFPEWKFNHELDHSVSDELSKISEFLKRFPKKNLFIPISKSRDGFDEMRFQWCTELEGLGFQILARSFVRFASRSDRHLAEVALSIQNNIPLKDLGLFRQKNAEHRVKSLSQMRADFQGYERWVRVSRLLKKECTFCLSQLRFFYPTEWIPADQTPIQYLRSECLKGMKKRYPKGADPKILKQLEYELSLVEELQFSDYFLTVHHIVQFARSRGILCQGRGSAANSIICYVLGITEVDPVRMNLLFERFISRERGEPPDIDVDFEHERREEVIQYLYETYGRDRAAMVAAMVTYQPRSALRDIAKAYGVSVGTLSAREVKKILKGEKGDSPLSDSATLNLMETVNRFLNQPRHISIHSGGFVLSHENISHIVPIEPATMEGRTIIQWDKYDLDILGLLKVDVLSLGMLSMIRKALQLLGKELHQIPAEDSKTYDMICRADTIGVFQIESRAQMSMLPRLKPRCFYDLVVEVALVRPGPIVGQMVHPYLRRRQGLEPVVMPHPKLISILGRTYGVPIFQEQVMKMAVHLAGFTAGEADQLRKAIGAWRSEGSIDEMGKRLQKGLLQAGLSSSYCEQIFNQIKGFSEYGFPESHAASFALLSYVSSYIKCHHPAEFLCAILNSQPMGFYSAHTLIDDAKRHGVNVLPICILKSHWDCQMEQGAVRMGFRYLKGIRESEVHAFLKYRSEVSVQSIQGVWSTECFSFSSMMLFAKGATFQVFGYSSREALLQVLVLQRGLFQWVQNEDEKKASDFYQPMLLPTMTPEEQVMEDYRTQNLSTRGHPMQFLRTHLEKNFSKKDARRSVAEVRKLLNRSFTKLAGLSIVLQRPPTGKGTAFATLEDETGVLDLIFHKEVFDRYRDVIRDESFFWVYGEIQRDGDSISMIVKKVSPLFSGRAYSVPIAPGAHARRY